MGMTKEDCKAFLDEHRITTVEMAITDIAGGIRGKRVPVDAFLQSIDTGTNLCIAMLIFDVKADIIDSSFSTWGDGYPDFFLMPDLDTLRVVPWRPATALVLCDAVDTRGDPIEVASRRVLRRAVERVEAKDLVPRIGPELEFYLLDIATQEPSSPTVPCYSLQESSEFEPVLEEIRTKLKEFGVPVESSFPEYAPGQFEMNIRFSDALSAADNAFLFKYGARQIAASHGLLVTFMAKPFTEHSGSGFHIHHSLWARDENQFWDSGSEGMSTVGGRYAAGLLHNLAATSAFGSQTVNAYKRRQPYSFAPINATLSGDNRTVAIRVLASTASATRIEQRDAAADANPYVVIAAQVLAGLDGLNQAMPPPELAKADAYLDDEAPRLPRSLDEALTALQSSELVAEAFHPSFLEAYTRLLEHERDVPNTVVTDWERDRYLKTS
jgi:glutamine synthetase